jgi:hypothetical protein
MRRHIKDPHLLASIAACSPHERREGASDMRGCCEADPDVAIARQTRYGSSGLRLADRAVRGWRFAVASATNVALAGD